MAKSFFGNVKQVLSGDTLVLTSANNPTLEKTFSLAFVSAPRMSKDGDEAFGFQSREFIRSLTVGHIILCNTLYTIPGSGREYGTAQLQDGTQFPEASIKAGWLRVREDAGKKEDDEAVLSRLENLRHLETQAKNEAKGLHAGKGGRIEVQNDLGGPDFITKWKGQNVDGVVERVISGDRIIVRLLLTDSKHWQVMTLLAGIRCPTTQRVANGQTQPAEEYGNEARAFLEQRMLQRLIKVKVVGTSPQGQLIASVLHIRNGNIALFLLSEGLARCNDHHSTMLGNDMAALREAEQKAKSNRVRLHKNHVPKAAQAQESDQVVSKVLSADSIFVRDKTGMEKRISISSVRAPRTNEPSEAPWKLEAKEFMRKKVIGKKAHISVDGQKPAEGDFEERDVATVIVNGKNIGLVLVREGYATVIRHRKNDTDRATNYDELLAAQEAAKEEKKGLWSGKAPKIKQYVDMSESVQKAKVQLSTLARQRKVPGIVDYCKSGSRFTVLIPRDSIKITMVLAGIRAPRAPGRNQTDKGEPFGQDAFLFVSRRCNQRECEIDIHDVDKTGGFIGDLYVGRESIGKLLVEEGLAQVHEYSAEKSGNASELLAAQKQAKDARKNLWHDWDPSQDTAQEGVKVVPTTQRVAEITLTEKPKDYRDIVVTHIADDGRLKFQEIGKGTSALITLMAEFNKFHADPKNKTAIKDSPKTGEYVAARFTADNTWYRARIRSNDRANMLAEVVFIDYGNTEKHPWANLRTLSEQFTVQKLKAQAIDASLSFVQLPATPGYLSEAIDFLYEETEGKNLIGSFDFVDTKEGISFVTLYDPKDKEAGTDVSKSINRLVLENGHGLVSRKLKAWERSPVFADVLKGLRQAENQAKERRSGMWEYGDLTED